MNEPNAAAGTVEGSSFSDLLCRIECTSVLGFPVWVSNVSEPYDTGGGMAPIVSMVNRPQKSKLYTRSEAEALLPQVHTCHPEARIVAA